MMSLGTLCTLVAIFTVSYAAPDYGLCNDETNPNYRVIIPMTGCREFVACWKSEQVGTFKCPGLTAFDEELDRCEDKENVTCTTTRQPFVHEVLCWQPVSEGNCTHYYQCDQNMPHPIMACPDGTYFSPTYLICAFDYQLHPNDYAPCGLEAPCQDGECNQEGQ